MLQIKTTAGEAMYETRGDNEAPTLILFHTLLADCSVYDGIIDRLAENFCVTRFNFPGYGVQLENAIVLMTMLIGRRLFFKH